jgi:hypothetical protein
MLHELDVVHVDLLAQVTLERHVSFELTAQNLAKKKETDLNRQFYKNHLSLMNLKHSVSTNA